MATITALPKNITRERVEALRNAFGFFEHGSTLEFKDKTTGMHLKNMDQLAEELWSLGVPKDTSTKFIGITLENWYETVTQAPEFSEPNVTQTPEFKGADEYPVSANRPTTEQIATGSEIAEKQKIIYDKTVEDANNAVRTAIEKQKEIYAEEIQKTKDLEIALENKKIYYKIERPPVEETEEFKNLKEQATANPRKFIADAETQFQNNPNLVNQSPDEARLAAEQAAITTYETLTDNSPSFQIAVAANIATNSDLLNKISPNLETQAQFKNILETFIEQKRGQITQAEQFINLSKIDSIANFENLTIKFSETPLEGYQEYDFNKEIVSPHIANLNQQSSTLNNILSLKELGEDEIKSQFLSAAGSRLESYIAGLPSNSLLTQTYNSEAVQLGLTSLGLAEITPWIAAEGSLFGKIVVGSGFGPLAGFIQTKTGIDLGIKIAAKAIAGKVAGTAAGGAVAGAVGGEVAGAAVGAAAGSIVPFAGTIIGFFAGLVGPKVVGWIKDNVPKFGKYIVSLVGAVFGFVLGGGSILGAFVGAGIGYGGATIVSEGVSGLGSSLTSFGSGVASFFGAIGGAFMGSIAVPILITLLGFPIVVVLVLFIINSGAYVVPPQDNLLSSANPYIGVQKTANPSKAASPTSVIYTVTITAKKDILSGITLTNTCKSTKKNSASVDCKDLENLPKDADIPSISPASPFSFTFTSNYGSAFQDSLISDTVTVSAKSIGGGNVSETGSASVCFGNCPLGCIKTVDNDEPWPTSYKANLDTAAATLAGTYPNFMAKVCPAGGSTVNLCFTTKNPAPIGSSGLCHFVTYAIHIHQPNCDVVFNQCGISNQNDALFTLTHEVTHHIQRISSQYLRKFDEQVSSSEWSICTYKATIGNDVESMAEGDGLFVAKPSWAGCITNYITQYPQHYLFAKNVMFAP